MLIKSWLSVTVRPLSLDSEATMTNEILLWFIWRSCITNVQTALTREMSRHSTFPKIIYFLYSSQHHAVRLQALEQKSLWCWIYTIGINLHEEKTISEFLHIFFFYNRRPPEQVKISSLPQIPTTARITQEPDVRHSKYMGLRAMMH